MAYESNDICPPIGMVKTADEKESVGENLEDSKMHEIESEVLNLRPADEDICPKQPSLKYVSISRQPDSKVGEKNNSDHKDNGTKTKREKSISPMRFVITWGLGGVLAIWLSFKVLEFSNFALELMGGNRWWAGVFIAIPFIVLIVVAIKFGIVFQKLPHHKQVRGDLRASDVAKKEKLKKALKSYICDLQKNKNYDEVFESEKRQKVSQCISRLSKESFYSDDGGWIDEFNILQKTQEDRAYEIVKTYCKLVALKTAACPWKAIDMVIVFVNLTLMVEEIAKVYNRRVSKAGAFRLLCQWFANIYISGELGPITENVTNQASDKVADWLIKGDGIKPDLQAGASVTEAAAEQVSEGVASGMADGGVVDSLAGVFSASLPVVSRFVGKAAEGAINAFLAYRMGKRAIEEFRFFIQTDN